MRALAIVLVLLIAPQIAAQPDPVDGDDAIRYGFSGVELPHGVQPTDLYQVVIDDLDIPNLNNPNEPVYGPIHLINEGTSTQPIRCDPKTTPPRARQRLKIQIYVYDPEANLMGKNGGVVVENKSGDPETTGLEYPHHKRWVTRLDINAGYKEFNEEEEQ
jgi:hypothetical protein